MNTELLRIMSNPEDSDHIPKVAGVSESAWVELLDRAEEVGLLTKVSSDADSALYRVHPALPWYFRERFLAAYGDPDADEAQALHAVRSYVEAVARLGDYLLSGYVDGQEHVLEGMRLEEENLLHAQRLARRHEWWGAVIGAMQGVRVLYDVTGRRAEWRRLVEEITPDFVDRQTNRPMSGLEDGWALVTEYRVAILRQDRHWEEAERLQRLYVDWAYGRVAACLDRDPDTLTDTDRNRARSYGAGLFELAAIQRGQGSTECVDGYMDAYELYRKFDFPVEAGTCAYALGQAHKDIDGDSGLDEAERWFRLSLDTLPGRASLHRASVHSELGAVARLRFDEAREADAPQATLLEHLNGALRAYHEALDMFPQEAADERAVVHNQLGLVYDGAGDLDQALHHFQEAVRYADRWAMSFALAPDDRTSPSCSRGRAVSRTPCSTPVRR